MYTIPFPVCAYAAIYYEGRRLSASWPYMISRQSGMKTDKDKIVWSHMTIIPFPQKCIRPELIRPCRPCYL